MILGRTYIIFFVIAYFFSNTAHTQIEFSEISREAGIDYHYLSINEIGGGAAFFDMDNDGDEDLWISGGLQRDMLYENDGTGNFTEIGIAAGLKVTDRYITTGIVTGDFNRDGFKDVLLTTHIGHTNLLLQNNGNKTFRNVSNKARLHIDGTYNLSATLADVNQDGLLDIYFADYIKKNNLYYNTERDTVTGFGHSCYENRLYINKGDWTFEEQSAEFGLTDIGCALAALFTDYDKDQDQDLLIANDFGAWVAPNALFQNCFPKDTFLNKSQQTGMDLEIYGMGISAGDFDNDMDLDYYITNIGANALLENQGNGQFIDKAIEYGVADIFGSDSLFTVGWGTAFFDADNDTDLDLYVVNGFVPAAPFITNGKAIPNRMFENDGGAGFNQIPFAKTTDSPQRGRGLAYADIDQDGDLDFIVVNVNRQATPDTIQKVQLFRNDSPLANNWLQIKLKGKVSNPDAYGAKVLLKANDRWYFQEANGGFGSHASQHSCIVHFGLGKANQVDSLTIIWPGGAIENFINLTVNQKVEITESNTITNTFSILGGRNLNVQIHPNPFSEETLISYSLTKAGPVNIAVFNQLGQALFEQSFEHQGKGTHQFKWKNKEKGLFYFRIQNRESQVSKLLITN